MAGRLKIVPFFILAVMAGIILFDYSRRSDSEDTNIVFVPSDDQGIAEAKKQAQEKLEYFIDFLQQNASNSSYIYSIKADFVDREEHEHMWVETESYSEGVFRGKLGNEPKYIKTIRYHDPVEIKRDDVEDWIVGSVEGNTVTGMIAGGFSVQTLQQTK